MDIPPIPTEAPTVAQMAISGRDRHGKVVLGVVAKRTYDIAADGRCTPASTQAPLCFGPIEDPAQPELIIADTDILLDKPLTDVIVRGHAWNHPRAPSFMTAAQVGRFAPKRVQVFGDRRCMVTTTGRLAFSQPSVLDKVPLSYAYAYGGCDERGEREGGFELQALAGQFPAAQRDLVLSAASPWRYPRNRCGRGYLVEGHPDSVAAVQLPNLEHPEDLLTPERLIAGDPWYWPIQPLPASFDWLEHGVFPRIAWFGQTPEWEDELLREHVDAFAEVRFGHADRRIFFHEPNLLKVPEQFDRQALNGASLGLRFPYLGGDEPVQLLNLHPQLPAWTVRMPGERPSLYVDDRSGGLDRLAAKLYTVLIEPDEARLVLVWAGFTGARRPYFEHELMSMPMLVEW